MTSIATNNPLSQLFTGPKASAPNIYDLVTGSKTDLTTSLFSSLTGQESSNLTDSQTNNFAALEEFITQNVSGADQTKLLTSLSALKKLTSLGNNDKASLDPIFSLLANNPDITKSLPTGSVVNQVA